MKKYCTDYNGLPQTKLFMRKERSGESMNVMRTSKVLILIIWGLGGLISCKQEDINATMSTLAANVTDINNYVVSKGISGSYTSSNLYFALTKASSSTVSATYGNELEFTYKLYALSGPSNSTITSTTVTNSTVVTDRLVDTVYARTPTFISFVAGTLKAGLEEGLLKMHEGESATLLVPSGLAFGNVVTAVANGSVPANSPVRYDVTLNRSRTETQQLNEYTITSGLSFTTTSSGLRIALTKANSAGDPVKTALDKGQIVTIRYVGKQLHAKTAFGFDSTSASGIQYVGENFVSGFNEAITNLRVGERATVLFTSSPLGYGNKGLVVGETDKTFKVSPNTPLRYDIEVVSVR